MIPLVTGGMFRHGTGPTPRSSKRRPRATCCIGQAETPAYGAVAPNGRKPHRPKETRHKARNASGRTSAHQARPPVARRRGGGPESEQSPETAHGGDARQDRSERRRHTAPGSRPCAEKRVNSPRRKATLAAGQPSHRVKSSSGIPAVKRANGDAKALCRLPGRERMFGLQVVMCSTHGRGRQALSADPGCPGCSISCSKHTRTGHPDERAARAHDVAGVVPEPTSRGPSTVANRTT